MVRLILIRVHQLIVFLRIIVPHLHIIKELALILQLPIRDHQLKEISGGGTTEFSFDFSVPNSVRSEIIRQYHFLMSWILLEINHLMSTP